MFVKFLTVRHAVFNAFEGHSALLFRDDDVVVRIPLTNCSVLFDFLAFFDKEHRTVWENRRGQRHIGLWVHHFEFRGTRHHNHLFLTFSIRAIDGPQIVNFNHTFVLGSNLVFVGNL